MAEVRMMIFDPGHFHAALVQKEMYAGVARNTYVYAALGPELIAYLNHVSGFNRRAVSPTAWELEVHAGPYGLERMLRERPGNVVVLAGFNSRKIETIRAALEAGLHVLADKPWILDASDLPKLATALDCAQRKGLIAYDIMTERHEVTSILQRELVNDLDTFGTILLGSPQEPAVFMESKHYLLKQVAGAPLRRPAVFFDIRQQGEGLTDVGTHLVDLVPWILFPDQAVDYRNEIEVLIAKRWPTVLSRIEFERITGEADFPGFLRNDIHSEGLCYYCNNQVCYRVHGVYTEVNVLWDYEAAAGGDTQQSIFRGTRARVQVQQGPEENYQPELYVVPNHSAEREDVLDALERKVASLQMRFPELAIRDEGRRFNVHVPEQCRLGHETHFAQVTRQFLAYLADPTRLPAWEKPNMLAKYHVTTMGVQLARAAVEPL